MKYTLQSVNLIKPIPLILKPRFWTCLIVSILDLCLFLTLHLFISNDIVSTEIYDKRDDFDFEIVTFPVLDGDVPRSTSYGIYIYQLI